MEVLKLIGDWDGDWSGAMNWTVWSITVMFIYTVLVISCSFYWNICIYIFTRKPGRSPTRQYGVLRPLLTCAPSLDFFLGVSRRFFFLQLRIKPIQGIRVKSVGWAHSTGSFGTSLTILFQSCEHRKKSWTTMQPLQLPKLGLSEAVHSEAVHSVAL